MLSVIEAKHGASHDFDFCLGEEHVSDGCGSSKARNNILRGDESPSSIVWINRHIALIVIVIIEIVIVIIVVVAVPRSACFFALSDPLVDHQCIQHLLWAHGRNSSRRDTQQRCRERCCRVGLRGGDTLDCLTVLADRVGPTDDVGMCGTITK